MELRLQRNGRFKPLAKFIRERAKKIEARRGAARAATFRKRWKKTQRALTKECRALDILSPQPTPPPQATPTPSPTPTPTPQPIPMLYYSEGYTVGRVNLETFEEQRNLLEREDVGIVDLTGLAFDVQENELYYADRGSSGILVTALDTGATRSLFSGQKSPICMQLDARTRRLFFVQDGTLYRSGLEGSGKTAIASFAEGACHIDVDTARGSAYLLNGNKLTRVDLSSGQKETLTLAEFSPNGDGIAVDPSDGSVLISLLSAIVRVEPDFETITTLSATAYAGDLEVDPDTRDILYVTSVGSSRSLQRISSEGVLLSSAVVRSAQKPLLAFDPTSGRVFLQGQFEGVNQYNLTSGWLSEVVAKRSRIIDVAVDAERGFLYFIDAARGRVERANLAGAAQMVLYQEIATQSVTGLALSSDGQWLYWISGGNKIIAAATNGSGMQTLYSSSGSTRIESEMLGVTPGSSILTFIEVQNLAGGVTQRLVRVLDTQSGGASVAELAELHSISGIKVALLSETGGLYLSRRPGFGEATILRYLDDGLGLRVVAGQLQTPTDLELVTLDGTEMLAVSDDGDDSIYLLNVNTGETQLVTQVSNARLAGITTVGLPRSSGGAR